MRFASHRDLMRIFRRAFAAAEIPVSFSQGFNPHPRFSFGPSLRTGWESLDEYMDVLLDAPAGDISDRCNLRFPEGLRILDTGRVREGVPKLSADVCAARYEIFVDRGDVFDRRSDLEKPLLDAGSDSGAGGDGTVPDPGRCLVRLEAAISERFSSAAMVRTAPGTGEPPVPVVLEVRCSESQGVPDAPARIEYTSTMHGGKSLFPEDILTPFLGDPVRYRVPVRVTRTALYVDRDGELVSPMSRAALETNA